ncbi:MAG: hypothetical protein ACOYIQ_03540 [Christensenellales bacterium]
MQLHNTYNHLTLLLWLLLLIVLNLKKAARFRLMPPDRAAFFYCDN